MQGEYINVLKQDWDISIVICNDYNYYLSAIYTGLFLSFDI